MNKSSFLSILTSILFSASVFVLFSASQARASSIGEAMPACDVTPLASSTVSNLEQFRGKIVYVDFWASWCPPCVKSFPFMNELISEFKDRGVEVVAVNLDEFPSDAEAFLSRHDTQFSVVSDESKSCAKAFNVKAMPSTYLIDRNGVIRHIHLGFRDDATLELKQAIEQLLEDNPAANNS